MDLTQLAHRLHKLNKLFQAGEDETSEAQRLDEELEIYHLRTQWNTSPKEWVIVDTRIYDREK